MIVEDNAGIRRLLRRILLDAAVSIWECSDGSEALAAYETHKPDLVLMDVRMPRVDGLTATRQIRDRDPSALIIVVTDYEDEEMRSAAFAAGARGFVLKQEIADLPMVVSSLVNPGEV